MAQSWLIVIFSLLLVLVMSGVLLLFYLRSLQEEIGDFWFILREKLHLRLDKLPALIQITSKLIPGQEALLKDVIFLRHQSWNNGVANRAKVATELNLSAQLHQIWDLGKQSKDLAHHSIFLQAQAELKELGQLIEKDVEKYNEKVRKFNKRVRFFMLRPFVLLFRYEKKCIFEFEP